MAEGKKSFVFYCNWKEVFNTLPNEKAGQLIKHILGYVNDENPEAPDLLIEAVFATIKPIIKEDLVKWEERRDTNKANGSKGGRPKGSTKKPKKTERLIKEPKNTEGLNEKAKKPVNDNVNVNAKEKNIYKKSLEERKEEFKKALLAERSEKYDKEILRDFFIYWSEHGDADKKMRWEKEKTFGLKARLHTFWKNREARRREKPRL